MYLSYLLLLLLLLLYSSYCSHPKTIHLSNERVSEVPCHVLLNSFETIKKDHVNVMFSFLFSFLSDIIL